MKECKGKTCRQAGMRRRKPFHAGTPLGLLSADVHMCFLRFDISKRKNQYESKLTA
jgi:hypothetical protein